MNYPSSHPSLQSNMASNEIEVHQPGAETPPTPSESKMDLARDRKHAELAHLEKQVINRDTHFVVCISVG